MLRSLSRRSFILTIALAVILTAYAGLGTKAVPKAAAATVYETRFMELYNAIKNPANGYFSPEGIPYHSIETLISEAPDYGHMTTSEAYSYWLWLEALYGHYTGDWSKLEAAWDSMEKYIIPINEGDGKEEQPTMSYYNPNSPATYAAEKPYPDQYPSQLSGQYAAGKDPLDAELKSTYGNNQTYLMHWLVDVDNWYGYGNLLNPSHTAAYVNTFQRGEQESVWEAIDHPSQDDKSFGKSGEGFMSLFTKETSAPSAQWRYTDATDADGRAIQVMYWAKQLGYKNSAYLDKAKKMGDYLRYGMFDKYFQKTGSAKSGTPTAGTGKDSSLYLMSWYTAWGGGLGSSGSGNWAWRIGSSHAHQAYQNPVTAYALSSTAGGLVPASATAQSDWSTSLTRQLEFYTWLLSSEGGMGGGATNSWNGSYSAYPSGVSQFYGLAYQEAPVYHDPNSNTWFGFQAWPLERVAELYYILASNGDTTSQNFQMAKNIIQKWIDWSSDYVFVDKKPVTDSDGYYLDASGQRVLGGTNPSIATTNAPGQFWIPSTLEWSGQPDTWNGFSSFTGNPTYHTITKDPGQDVGVLGSYIKALTFFAAGTKAETGSFTTLGTQAKTLADQLLGAAWNYNDGIGIAIDEPRGDYYRYFTKEIYIPNGWTGLFGQGNTIPGSGAVASDPAKGGNGTYISYSELRPKITLDPKWSYLTNLYNTSWNAATKTWDNGTPTFKYHRFWSQVDIATAYAEYDRLLGGGTVTPTVPAAPASLTAAAGNAQASLSWSASSGATSYNVKRSTTSGGAYTTIATGVNATSYTDTGLTNGTTYYYVVSAVNAAGESVNSVQASATPQQAIPAAPTGLAATPGNAQVSLSWNSSSGATGYNVKRATTSGGPYTTIATSVAATTYTDTGLTNGTTYYYAVSAVNAAGESANSAQVGATPSVPSSSLVVQYRTNNANATDNQIYAQFNIKNTGTSAVNLSGLKLRYYFTKDGSASLNYWVDYAVVGSSNVSGSFVTVSPAKTGADTYLELSFGSGAGSIAAGGQSGDIQVRVAKSDWTNFNEVGDYSYDPTKTSFADWSKATLYQNGTLAWGTEP